MLEGEPIWVLGAMSGTSLDGVDAAMLQTDGRRIYRFGQTGYRPYSDAERAAIRAALGCWPDAPGVAEATAVVVPAHQELFAEFEGADLVGFHGQTLAHDPTGRGTHQAGTGPELGMAVPVVWDFRTQDVAQGGQGAPLASFFHHACARWIGAEAPMAFLNLGGVGNITWVDPTVEAPEDPGACLAFDTGPANAPVNDLMQARRGLPMDEAGALAAIGQVDSRCIEDFLRHSYFSKNPPKSLDRNDFSTLIGNVANLSDADAAATLTAACAGAVAASFQHLSSPPNRLLVTGGGRHNGTLMRMIADKVMCPVLPVEAVGLDGDMLEAQAFAYLAARVRAGLPTSAPGTTGVAKPVSGGRISLPAN